MRSIHVVTYDENKCFLSAQFSFNQFNVWLIIWECAEEFKNLFQSKILDPKSEELEYEKWYNIEQIRQHRGNNYGIDSTVESAKVARASTIGRRISSSECALKTNPENQTALPITLKQSQ